MNDASAPPLPGPRYRLETFGTLALRGPDGETVLGGHGHHRRRLALLAVLAAAGERGRSRDQLLALFWPEATQARARHSLDQLLYALRSTLGDTLFASRDPVRLDPAVLASDVQGFDTALERDDPRTAVELHRGPFLDGFHAGDELELERWLDAERSRIEQRFLGALARLAERDETSGDHASAVTWRRRLADADPLSAKGAAGLIRALKNAGDHAAALKHAERYESLVAQELGTSVGPDVASLVADVRAEAAAVSLAAGRSAPPEIVRGAKGADGLAFADARAKTQGEPIHALAPSRRSSRTLALGIVAVVAIAGVAAFVGLRATRGPHAPARAEEATIAVLPFASVGGDGDDSLVVEGVSADLIQALARMGAERVLALDAGRAIRTRSGARRRALVDSLDVTHVVEGDIRWSGPRVRAEVRLLDATGGTRWSETYDRARDEVFLVQREAAVGVARALGVPIASASLRALDRPLTRNIAAYELFLRGRDQVNFRFASDSGLRRGLAYLQQAVALDSGFAAAYANMTYMYSLLGGQSTVPESGLVYRQRTDSVARKAMALDPMLPESHTALAIANLSGFRDLGAAERALRRSIALGGSPRVHEHLANVLHFTGRTQEALVETMRSAADDPLSATAAAELGKALCASGRVDEGLARLAVAATVKPPLQRVRGHAAFCHGMRGDWPRVVELLRPAHAGQASSLFGYSLARAGRTAEATAMRDASIARWNRTRRGAYDVALISAGLQERDQTFLWLDRAVDDLSIQSAMQYGLLFRELHGDPRWARLLARVGFRSDTAARAGAETPTRPPP